MDIKSPGQVGAYSRLAERPEITAVQGQQAQKAQGPRQPAKSSDKVSVSPEAMLRTEAYKTAMTSADVRQERVNAIKARIADGSYTIDTKKIAMALLTEDAVTFAK